MPFVPQRTVALVLPRWFAAASLCFVLLLGLYYSFTNNDVNRAPGETGLSALALLHTGVIADPYLLPTGPTAHTAPGTVAELAALYAVFGGNTGSARIGLSLIATLLYLSATLVVLAYCRIRRFGAAGLAVAIGLTCLVPVHLYASVVSYRQWDQPIAAVLLVALLFIWTRPQSDHLSRVRRLYLLALLGGIGSLFAPAVPIVAMLALAALALQEKAWRHPALAATLIIASMMPWAVRNELVLGKFIMTRSNFALELAVGNYDGATGTFDLSAVPPVHPHDFPAAAQRLAAVGEVAYMNEMRMRALAWIRAHPAEFFRLSLRRVRLLLFPEHADRDPLFTRVKTRVIWGTSLLALFSLGAVLVRRQPVFPWIACIGVPLAPYLLTHASERYAYPTFYVMVCLIATGTEMLQQLLRARWNHAKSVKAKHFC